MAQDPFSNQTESSMAWDDIRTSQAFPAIVGALAGAAIGVGMMFIANRLSQPKRSSPAAYDANGNPMNVVYLPTPNQFRILGFTVGDLLTLATVGVSLARQMQEIAKTQKLDQQARELQEQPQLLMPPPVPPPADPTAAAKKK